MNNGVVFFESIANDATNSEPINNPTVYRDNVYELKFDNDVLHWEQVIYD